MQVKRNFVQGIVQIQWNIYGHALIKRLSINKNPKIREKKKNTT